MNKLPLDLINHLLSFRPTHPVAVLLKHYIEQKKIWIDFCNNCISHYNNSIMDCRLEISMCLNDSDKEQFLEDIQFN